MTVAGVLLAAGAGTRFRGATHKLLAEIDGRSVVSLALDAVIQAGLDEVVIVTGARELGPVVPEEVTVVHNPLWQQGQATSLQAAIAHCRSTGHHAMVVGLGDQPGVGADAWRALAEVDAPVAVATYEGRRGNPVRLESSVWDLIPDTGDEGARPLLRERPDLITRVACSGRADDIDTTEDLQRWN